MKKGDRARGRGSADVLKREDVFVGRGFQNMPKDCVRLPKR